MKQSPRFTLVRQDVYNWLHNALIFLAPAILAMLGVLITQVKAANTTNVADSIASIALVYVLNVLTDLLRKYVSGPAS